MKGLKTFIAGILTIVLSFLVISTVFIFCISSFASSKNIQKNLESVSILKDVKKVRNSGSVGSQSKITTAINDIYSLAGQYSISSSVVDKMLDSKATKEILGKSVGNITDYVINGKKAKSLSSDDIYNIISSNFDDLVKTSGSNITASQKEKFLREVKKQIPDIVSVIPTSNDLLGKNYSNKIMVLQKIFSNKTKGILVMAILVLLVLIVALKKEGFQWCKNIGVSLLISGLVMIGMYFIIPAVVVEIMTEADMSIFASSLTEFLDKPVLFSGIGLVVISILLFTFYKIMEKRGMKKVPSLN